MIELLFRCDQSDLQFLGGPRVAEGCRDYVQARFELGRDWTGVGVEVYATFKPRASVSITGAYVSPDPVDVSVDQRGTCYVPQSCLVWPGFSVCLHARSERSDINSSVASVPVSRSIESGCGTAAPGVEDALKWANEALEVARCADVKATKVADAAESGAFDGARGASFAVSRSVPENGVLDGADVTAPDGKLFPYDLILDPEGSVWMVDRVSGTDGGTVPCPCGCGCLIPVEPGEVVVEVLGPQCSLKGPQGEPGRDGDTIVGGIYGFEIDEAGHLLVEYEDGDADAS